MHYEKLLCALGLNGETQETKISRAVTMSQPKEFVDQDHVLARLKAASGQR
jgi:hypothetical protein